MNDCTIRLPSEGQVTHNNFNRKERLSFVVYADLQCFLEKTEEKRNYQHHKVFSIAYYIHCAYDDSLSAYHSCRNIDCIAWFVEELKNLAQRVKIILITNVPIVNLTREEWEKFYCCRIATYARNHSYKTIHACVIIVI
ncbi:hypothetical protein ACFW04_011514 [Cataglyphis niger]